MATQSSSGGVADGNMSQHQARLQAAAAAASIYEKSYAYPSANTLVWYDLLCHYNVSVLTKSMYYVS